MRCLGPQDDVAAFRRCRHANIGEVCACCILCIDQICEIKIFLILQYCAILNGNMACAQHNAATCVDLTGDHDPFFRRFIRIKFQIGRLIVAFFNSFIFICLFVAGAKILKVTFQGRRYFFLIIPQIIKITAVRRQSHKLPGIDHTRTAYHHAVRAEEIQIAVNFAILYGVQRAVHIDTFFHQVDQVVHINRLVLLVKIHIGNMPAIKVEFIKLVDTQSLVYDFLGINVIHVTVLLHNAVYIRYFRRPPAHRKQQQTRRHRRYRPLRFCRQQQMSRQAFHDRSNIIFAVVFRNLRHNHIAFSHVAPDYFVNPVHDNPRNAQSIVIIIRETQQKKRQKYLLELFYHVLREFHTIKLFSI